MTEQPDFVEPAGAEPDPMTVDEVGIPAGAQAVTPAPEEAALEPPVVEDVSESVSIDESLPEEAFEVESFAPESAGAETETAGEEAPALGDEVNQPQEVEAVLPQEDAAPAEPEAPAEPPEVSVVAEDQPADDLVAVPVGEEGALVAEEATEAVVIEELQAPTAEATEVLPDTASADTAVVPEPVAVPAPVVEPEPVVVPEPAAAVDSVPTEVVATETAVLATAPIAASQGIFRDEPPQPEATRVVDVEAERLAAERAALKEARDAALAVSEPEPVVAPEPVVVVKRTTDKFLGSVGLFLLRLVVAGILAIRGFQMLANLGQTETLFRSTVIPEPAIMALVTGVASLLIALSLVLGLLTRVAGLGAALIGGGAVAFVMWGPTFNPFTPGQNGFLGELELLLAAVGVMFILVGAGGWSLDRSFRASRARDKAERAAQGL